MRHTQLPDPHTGWTEDDARLALEAWHQSGKTIAVFAREYGMSAPRLYWWRRRLGKATATEMSLVPAKIIERSQAAITIRAPNGVEIEIASASPAWIAALVHELMRSS